jgi:AAA domain, putative AbiEii toxin, Type IV TA system
MQNLPVVDSLAVKDFRQFDELSISGLSPVSLIGGKNNTGKSSLLEALYLLVGDITPTSLLALSTARRTPVDPATNETLWRYLFRNGDTTLEPKLTRVFGANEAHLRFLVPADNDTRLTENGRSFLNVSLPGGGGPASLDHFLATFKTCPTGHAHEHAALVVQSDRGLQLNAFPTDFQEPARKATQVRYVSTSSAATTEALAERFSALRTTGNDDAFIAGLKIFDPEISGAEIVVHLGRPALAVKRRSALVPLSYVGEGVVRMANILLAVDQSRGGLVLIDEAENGLHHSTHQSFWETLHAAAAAAAVQVVATTHSAEFTAAAGNVFSSEDSMFTYIRLDVIDRHVLSTVYSAEEIVTASELGSEVR